MSNERNYEGLIDLSRYAPEKQIVEVIAGYLKTMPFMQFLDYSIYTYPREDLSTYNKPAVFIWEEGLSAKNTVIRNGGEVNIELELNPTQQNREAIFNIISTFKAHTRAAITSDPNLWARLEKLMPYVNFIAEEYRESKRKNGVKITFNWGYLFQFYKEYMNQVQWSASGEKNEIGKITDVNVEVVAE